jgi:hypothetical protein
MAEKPFFGKAFEGKSIRFESTQTSWINLGEKILERYAQLDECAYNDSQAASVAWEIYTCQNANNPAVDAILKIYMQYIHYASYKFLSYLASQTVSNLSLLYIYL